MAKPKLRAGTSPFAHLLALVSGRAAAGKRAEDEKPEDDAEDEDGDADAEDDTPEKEGEDDKPDEGAEDEETDEPEKGKKGKRAKAEESDDEDKAEDPDDDDEQARARAEGYAAAQARGRKIFEAASAGMRPDMAAHLAFNDTMPSASAIAMLDMAAGAAAVPVSKGSRLGRRMARVVLPAPGTGGAGGRKDEMSFGDLAKAAGKKAGIF